MRPCGTSQYGVSNRGMAPTNVLSKITSEEKTARTILQFLALGQHPLPPKCLLLRG
jgi:hypothetical protein